jgi:RNA polymerase sigma-70 factor (ECF subfamily)
MTQSTRQVTVEEVLAETSWLRALARDLVGDRFAADDVVQETLLTALSRRSTIRQSLRGWLRRVLRNVYFAERRSRSRRTARERAVPARSPSRSVVDTVSRAEEHRRVVDAALGLEEPFRSTVLLRYFDGLAPAEIAVRTGVDPATVRTRLHRATARLRDRLSEGRADWRMALLTVLGTAAGGRAAAAGGGVAVTVTTKIALVTAAVVLVGGGVWLVTSDPEGPPPPAKESNTVAAGMPMESPGSGPDTDSAGGPVPDPKSEVASTPVEEEDAGESRPVEGAPLGFPAAKSDVNLEAVITMEATDMSLRDALALLSAFANVEFDTNLLTEAELESKVSCKFDQTALSDVLEFICLVKGHTWEVGSRGITIR